LIIDVSVSLHGEYQSKSMSHAPIMSCTLIIAILKPDLQAFKKEQRLMASRCNARCYVLASTP
jgi:hypothetical protein